MSETPNEKAPGPVPGVRAEDALAVGDRGKRQSERTWLNALLPNRAVSANTMRIIVAFEVLIFVLIWLNSPFDALPRPGEVFQAFGNLWRNQGLGREMITSFSLNLRALAISSAIALGLGYLTVIPVFRPITAALSKGRFLSLAGFTFIFTLMVGGGAPLKTSLMVLGISVFYITSMASVIAAIPKAEFDHARTLRMSEWRVVWEVVVLGTMDKALEVLRQNAAIGWMMLTMVEGIARSEGGVGAMLLNQQKYFRLPEVFAIQIAILLVGLGQDWFIGFVRNLLCPYANLTLERK
jgi:NitT/TauT family transport system permease protein